MKNLPPTDIWGGDSSLGPQFFFTNLPLNSYKMAVGFRFAKSFLSFLWKWLKFVAKCLSKEGIWQKCVLKFRFFSERKTLICETETFTFFQRMLGRKKLAVRGSSCLFSKPSKELRIPETDNSATNAFFCNTSSELYFVDVNCSPTFSWRSLDIERKFKSFCFYFSRSRL